MHRIFPTLIFILVNLYLHPLWSASGKPKPWGLALNLGCTNISFSGVSGSDFSSFTHYQWDFSIQHFRQKGWQWFGLGSTQIPGLAFKDVRWSDGNYGDYSATFQTYYAFVGGAHGKFRWALLGGYESITWKGSPASGPNKPNYFTNGVLMGWDWKQKGRFNFPIYMRYWRKPHRQVTFINYPSDSVNANPGSEFDISMGVHFGF